VLPAASAGGRMRKTCQKGKFHGMMASTGSEGIEADVAPARVGLARLPGEELLACSA